MTVVFALVAVAATMLAATAGPSLAGDLLVTSDGRSVTARLSASHAVWVGCTVFQSGDEVDLPAKYATPSGVVSFQIPRRLQASGANYVCSTWARRVERCGCEYCTRNGYHLEQRQATFEGRVPTVSVLNTIRNMEADSERMIREHPEQVQDLLWFFADKGLAMVGIPASPKAAITGNPCDLVTLPVECTATPYVRTFTLVVGDQCVFGDCDGFARWRVMH